MSNSQIIVCPFCQRGIRSNSDRCSCGRRFDSVEWPQEAYSTLGMTPVLGLVGVVGHSQQEYSFCGGSFQIGTNPQIDGIKLPTNSRGVSEHHAQITLGEDGWYIENLSEHGTKVDDEPIEGAVPLLPGAEIWLGAYPFKVTIFFQQLPSERIDNGTCNEEQRSLDDGDIAFGSDAKRCQVIIEHGEPLHAKLYKRRDSQEWYLVDCASKSGVKVNGQRIRNKLLSPGDEISIAGVSFIFHGDHLEKGSVAGNGVRVKVEHVDARVICANGQEKSILDDLNFQIQPGEFVGVIGPSGCGKSSVIQRIVGLSRFTSGKMYINGSYCENGKLPDGLQQSMCYLPQINALHSYLTLGQEIASCRSLLGMKGCSISHEAALKALQLVGLEHEVGKLNSQLSGGQKRRAGIAIGLLRNPELLVLDEPTSGLDPATERDLMNYLRRVSNQGRTVICTTHIMDSLEKFDKVLVLSRGKQIFFGSPDELLKYFQIKRPQEIYKMLLGGSIEDQQEVAEYLSQCFLQKGSSDDNASAASHSEEDFSHVPSVNLGKQVWGYWKRMFFELISFVNGGNWWKKIWFSSCFIQLFLQPFLVAIVLKAACANQIFSFSDVKEVLFFALVSVFWFGINNSVRELVKERVPFRGLERLERISYLGYLFSKVTWATAMSILQCGIFAIFLFGTPNLPLVEPNGLQPKLLFHVETFFALALTSVVGSWIGLAISACFKQQNGAVSLLPILLIPVIFFSQPIIRNSNYDAWPLEKNDGQNDKKNYNRLAVSLQKVMPCHWPQVYLDRVNNNRNDKDATSLEQVRDAKRWMLIIAGLYMISALALMMVFQDRNERGWDGR